MSHTNSTTNYNLSQFVGSDKPAWLTDYNGDMLAIDAQMKLNAEAAAANANDIDTIEAAIGAEGLAGRMTQAENDITSIDTLLGDTVLPTTAQSVTGAIAELKGVNDTQNGAISDNAAEIIRVAGSIEGVAQVAYTIADVYDATETYAVGDYALYQGTLYKCTTAINVGEAFDPTKWTSVKVMNEMPSGGGGGAVDADDVSYDNTQSGLSATNVQDAIDELATGTPVQTVEAQRGTIAAGSTSATLTFDNTIEATTFVDWYVGDGTITPTSVTTTAHTVVITIPAQSAATPVGAVIRN